jgi:hypothetical protein
VRWTKGTPAYDVTQSGEYVIQRYVVLDGSVYQQMLKPAFDQSWGRYSAKELQESERGYLTDLTRRMNPALLYPGLSKLKVTRGKPLKVDGVVCWPYTVRMTLRQNLTSMPEGARWDRAAQAVGTTVTTFYVDATGLPHKVVEASREGHSRLNAVTVLTGWGTAVTVTAPI